MLQIALLLAFIIPGVLFFLAQQKTLQVISPENREMSPGSVWLQFIPAFGMVWQFIVVTRIARSISKEMVSKMGESILDHSKVEIKGTDESPTYIIGIAYCILTTLGVIINYSNRYSPVYLGLFGTFFVLAGMACWIIYWVRLVNAKNKLVELTLMNNSNENG
ncbi:MAG TPA: hypothetical protein VK622_13730 [Puia sp.]|nr:hypothetical protein [Puia sp.]